MAEMSKTCCVTGNRPQKFPWNYETSPNREIYLADMYAAVEELIAEGYRLFISGGALGVDLDFAEAVLRAKKKHPEVMLELALPCEGHSASWSERDKIRLAIIEHEAHEVIVLSESYTPNCMQVRNRYMVDKSDLVYAFWSSGFGGGTKNTLEYAKKRKRAYRVYDLNILAHVELSDQPDLFQIALINEKNPPD